MCMYIVFMVVFTLVGRLAPGNTLLAWLLLAIITIITAYPITSNGSYSYYQAGQLTDNNFSGIICTYMYILYLRHEDALPVILYMGLPIITTLAIEQLNILIFHQDIKCITANVQTIIYVEANYFACDNH